MTKKEEVQAQKDIDKAHVANDKVRSDATTQTEEPVRNDLIQPEVHQKIIRMNPMVLISLFMKGNKIGVVDGVAAGTRYVGGGYDPATNTYFLHIENDRFDPVRIGDLLPVQTIQLEDLNNVKA